MKRVLSVCLTVLLPGLLLAAGRSRSTGYELQKANEELQGLRIRYTDQHPLVLAKREQIGALEKRAALRQHEQSVPGRSPQNKKALQKACQELNALLTRYTERHPLVVAKREQIVSLEQAANSP